MNFHSTQTIHLNLMFLKNLKNHWFPKNRMTHSNLIYQMNRLNLKYLNFR
jgi:hypothetical protein